MVELISHLIHLRDLQRRVKPRLDLNAYKANISASIRTREVKAVNMYDKRKVTYVSAVPLDLTFVFQVYRKLKRRLTLTSPS